MMNSQKLYWLGNSAKTKIISHILGQLSAGQSALVFDYGCGDGGDWPAILQDYPQLKLVGYEPHRVSYLRAKERLKGYAAELYTGDDIKELRFQADYIVSFSVFEHVYDRNAYLQNAYNRLHEHGVFYLSYDDGHFRTLLHLDQPRRWFCELRVWLHNLLAPFLARMGHIATFQQRAIRAEVDRLVQKIGFEVEEVFYSNIASLKGLHSSVPQERSEEFTKLWLELEERLNRDFLCERTEYLGDTSNLWKVMGTRTLVLKKTV